MFHVRPLMQYACDFDLPLCCSIKDDMAPHEQRSYSGDKLVTCSAEYRIVGHGLSAHGRASMSKTDQFWRYAKEALLSTRDAKSILLVAALLQVTLLEPTSAADSKSDECGLASVYSTDSERTASGEDTQPEDFTAAHRSLPFGTLVRVVNQDNGRSAVVRITDRGPFTSGRIIDLSKIAACELRISGLTQVCLNIISTPESRPAKN